MSQSLETSQVPSAFRRPPLAAQYAAEGVARMNQPMPQGAGDGSLASPAPTSNFTAPPDGNAQLAQQRVVIPAAPPKGPNTILPTTPSVPVQPASVAPPTPSESEQPSTPSAAPVPGAADLALQRQLEAERQAFAQREQQYQTVFQQQQAQMAELAKAQQELALLKQQQEVAAKFSSDEAFAGLETVDAADARRIAMLTAEAMSAPLVEERKRLEQERAQMQTELKNTQAYAAQQAQLAQSARLRDELLKAHPDFFTLYDSDPAFRQYLNARDGLRSETREQSAMAEYNKGNVAYVIQMLNDYKGQKPGVASMQNVAPVQVANAAPAPAPAVAPQYTEKDLIYFMQTGQITQDQFRQMLRDVRAAQAVQSAV